MVHQSGARRMQQGHSCLGSARESNPQGGRGGRVVAFGKPNCILFPGRKAIARPKSKSAPAGSYIRRMNRHAISRRDSQTTGASTLTSIPVALLRLQVRRVAHPTNDDCAGPPLSFRVLHPCPPRRTRVRGFDFCYRPLTRRLCRGARRARESHAKGLATRQSL
jgi:hypothetical protein